MQPHATWVTGVHGDVVILRWAANVSVSRREVSRREHLQHPFRCPVLSTEDG